MQVQAFSLTIRIDIIHNKGSIRMDTFFDQSLIGNYHSKSQIIRVLTETWVLNNIYCPRCGYHKILHFPNNSAVADFYCPMCKNEYELKSKNGAIGHKIADGAYDTFIQRITSNNNPDFFILSYNADMFCVENLWIVPKHFFVPSIVEKRRPLSSTAKRAGWIGCNILFDEIPVQGRISIIQNRIPLDKNSVITQVQRATFLSEHSLDTRSWLLDVLGCINEITSQVFSLKDIYAFEDSLSKKHPQNHNVRPKIRQQLQILRDQGFIEFVDRGFYRKNVIGIKSSQIESNGLYKKA